LEGGLGRKGQIGQGEEAMKTFYVYPGSFCPPTFGHVEIVKRAAEMFPELTIICSVSEKKREPWFAPRECAEMWRAYDLPKNVRVKTLNEFLAEKVDPKNIVMVRGLRGECDAEEEKRVMMLNWKKYGINQFFFFITDAAFVNISSSNARKAAEEFDLAALSRLVAPLVVTKLLEKVLRAKSVWLVVGQPGAGKSTCLRQLEKLRDDVVYVNTDEFSHALRPSMESAFGGRDLAQVAVEEPEKLKRVMGERWLARLAEALRGVRAGAHVFVEIGYAMRPGFELYRYVGGRILYIGMDNYAKLVSRVRARGTPEHAELIYTIPHSLKTAAICQDEKMKLVAIDTECSLDESERKVRLLAERLDRDLGQVGRPEAIRLE